LGSRYVLLCFFFFWPPVLGFPGRPTEVKLMNWPNGKRQPDSIFFKLACAFPNSESSEGSPVHGPGAIEDCEHAQSSVLRVRIPLTTPNIWNPDMLIISRWMDNCFDDEYRQALILRNSELLGLSRIAKHKQLTIQFASQHLEDRDHAFNCSISLKGF
jgi:hypothetical protein